MKGAIFFMRWINFEPGDATRYIVGLGRLRDADMGAFPGGQVGDYVFSFGTGSGPLTTFAFGPGYLEYGYYVSKMLRSQASPTERYTLTAGWIVLRYVADLPGTRVVLADEIRQQWENQTYNPKRWQQQLDALRDPARAS